MMMRALKMFDYGPKRLQPGDAFRPDNAAEGNVLAQAQLAVVIEDDKALIADDDKPTKKSKKRYQRADMRAEEDE